MWESLGGSYLEAATKSLPLYRIFIFAAGLFFFIIADQPTHKSVIESAVNIKITALLSTDEFFKDATVKNVLQGLASSFFGWVLSRVILRIVFEISNKSASITKKLQNAYDAFTPQKAHALKAKQEEVDFLNLVLAEPRNSIKRYSAIIETASGLSIIFVGCFISGGVLDLILAVMTTAIAILFQFKALIVFLSDYIGPALIQGKIMGRKIPDLSKIT